MSKNEHSLPFGAHNIYVAEYGERDEENTILMLHGAGGSSSNRISGMCETLAERGYYILVPDFIGHGMTGGELSDSSLEKRYQVVQTVLSHFEISNARAVVGFSMGAQTSIDLLRQDFGMQNFILVVPGVYDETAFSIPFGPDFTTALRREKSWEDTKVWELLEPYDGSLIVISAEHDPVIPPEIPQRLLACAKSAEQKHHLVLRGANHAVTAKIKEDNAFSNAFTDLIQDWIERSNIVENLKCATWKAPSPE